MISTTRSIQGLVSTRSAVVAIGRRVSQILILGIFINIEREVPQSAGLMAWSRYCA